MTLTAPIKFGHWT